MPLAYLAGPIDGYDGDTSWRDTVQNALAARGWAVFDPSAAFTVGVDHLETGGNSQAIRAVNRAAIDACKLVFAYLLAPSVGTCREIEYAAAHGKRVIVVHNAPKVELHDVERVANVADGIGLLGDVPRGFYLTDDPSNRVITRTTPAGP